MPARLTTIMAAVVTAAALAVGSAPAASALPGQAAASRAAASGAGATAPVYARPACGSTPAPGRAECLALLRTTAAGKPLTSGTNPSVGYTPAQLQAAYELAAASSDRGAGQTVALVDAYDDPTAESDLATYRAQYGLPPCTTASGCFRKVNQDGAAAPLPSPDPNWGVEESLDLDMVSAICPKCHIILAEANDNQDYDLAATVATAARLGATEISNSYGGPEYPGELALEPFYDQPGVQVTAAAGDAGFGVEYPASSAYVTAVGGTSLWPSSGSRGWTESAWPGTGSGCSAIIARPAWQHDSCTHRADNDVAAVADPNTSVAIYDSYGQDGWGAAGGTSVATPIIAAVYALLGDPKAAGGSYFYQHRGDLFDVTSGQDGTCSPAALCTAGPGYDMPTGLGTPDFTGARDTGGGSCVSGFSATSREAYPSFDQAMFFPETPAINAAVDALGPKNVWTVGSYDAEDDSGPGGSEGWVSNIEHWTGTHWSRTPSPSPFAPGGFKVSTFLSAVSFDRASDGWAAGFTYGSPMVAHWNGSRWSLSPVLAPVATYQTAGQTLPLEGLPTAVAALSPDNVWLAGQLSASLDPQSINQAGSFMEHWNGSTWSMVTIPDAAHMSLEGLAAISASDVWAVGATFDSSGNSAAVTLHWDGRAWSAVSPPAASSTDTLFSVSGSAADDVWAVGSQLDSSGATFDPLTEHWNGRAWSVVAAPAPPSTGPFTALDGVTTISATDAWAAGQYWGTRAEHLEKRLYLLEHWDGQKWSVVATPQTPVPNGLQGVSASSSASVWIAGSQQLPDAEPGEFTDDPYNLHSGCGHE